LIAPDPWLPVRRGRRLELLVVRWPEALGAQLRGAGSFAARLPHLPGAVPHEDAARFTAERAGRTFGGGRHADTPAVGAAAGV
jgi:hypothetical protein